jgi:periplasmic protein TonB
MARALADGNLERAAAVTRQAQQSGSVPTEQVTRWRNDIVRRQEDQKVQKLAALAEERIHDGRLSEGEDGASAYAQQLQALAPGNPATARVVRELIGADLKKARDAALAKNNTEEERWLGEARALGLKAADVAAFQREVAGARAKAVAAESDRTLQLARTALREGRLTDPAQDSAAYYLTQLQNSDPTGAGLLDGSRELAGKLLERARAAALAGKPADADLAAAKRWGADPKDLQAVQQLSTAPKAKGVDPATLAASLRKLRSPAPDYPPQALLQKIAGNVTLEYTVDATGTPRDVHVIEATPPGVFDQAAVNAVKRWRYAPVQVNGAAVEVPVKTRMRFELPK